MPFTVEDRDRLLRDPRRFLDTCLLSVAVECYLPELPGHADLLTLEESQGDTVAYRQITLGEDVGLERIRLFDLVRATEHHEVTFPAYVIAHEEGETPRTTLGTEASLAFTAVLTGCTLGIGSQAGPAGSLVVTHSNARGQGSQQANTAAQHDRAITAIGRKGTLFEPDDYRVDGKRRATVVGFRDSGQVWQFVFQSWTAVSGMILKSYGVRDITLTNTRF